MMEKWKAELVRVGDLRLNTPFYAVNPNENRYAYPHYADGTQDPDDIVWVLYEPDLDENPYLK